MVQVINNDIELTRGDSLYLDVQLTTDDGKPYDLEESAKIIFTLRKGFKIDDGDDNILLRHEVHELPVRIAPEETGKLEYGEYAYDVELQLQNGDVFTVIPIHAFVLTEEVG